MIIIVIEFTSLDEAVGEESGWGGGGGHVALVFLNGVNELAN